MTRYSDIVVHSTQQQIIMNDQLVRVTAAQFDIFKMLWHARGKVVRFQSIYSSLYQLRPACDQPDFHTVKTQVCKLRRKLEPLNLSIPCAWLEGYRLHLPSENVRRIAA